MLPPRERTIKLKALMHASNPEHKGELREFSCYCLKIIVMSADIQYYKMYVERHA